MRYELRRGLKQHYRNFFHLARFALTVQRPEAVPFYANQ
jgi:hypothetical protein